MCVARLVSLLTKLAHTSSTVLGLINPTQITHLWEMQTLCVWVTYEQQRRLDL